MSYMSIQSFLSSFMKNCSHVSPDPLKARQRKPKALQWIHHYINQTWSVTFHGQNTQISPHPHPIMCLLILQVTALLSVYLIVLGLVVSSSISAHLVWFQRYQWYRKYRIDKDSIKFWMFTVTLTLTKAVNSSQKTLQLKTMHHSIKFDYKRISISMDKVKDSYLIV